MKYFTKEMSEDEAKKIYRKMAVKLHPDKGGDHESFVELQNEYEDFLKGNFSYSEERVDEEFSSADNFFKANEFVQGMKGVIIEITGSWVWLSGNTYPYKTEISSHGYRYSASKKKWYKAPTELGARKKRGTSFDKIQAKYGHKSFSTASFAELN